MKKLYTLSKNVSKYPCTAIEATKKELVGLIQWNDLNREYEHTAEMKKLAIDIRINKLAVPIQLALYKGIYTEMDGRGRLTNPDIRDNETFLAHVTEFKQKPQYRAAMGMFNNSRKYHGSMKAYTEKEVFVFLDLIAELMRPSFIFQNQTKESCTSYTFNYYTLKRIVIACYMGVTNTKNQAGAWSEIEKTTEYAEKITHHMQQYVKSIQGIDADKRINFLSGPALIAWASLFNKDSKTKNYDSWFNINHYGILEHLNSNKTKNSHVRQAFWVYTFSEVLGRNHTQKNINVLSKFIAIKDLKYKEVH